MRRFRKTSQRTSFLHASPCVQSIHTYIFYLYTYTVQISILPCRERYVYTHTHPYIPLHMNMYIATLQSIIKNKIGILYISTLPCIIKNKILYNSCITHFVPFDKIYIYKSHTHKQKFKNGSTETSCTPPQGCQRCETKRKMYDGECTPQNTTNVQPRE